MIWVLAVLTIAIVLYVRHKLNFWKNKGVPSPDGLAAQMKLMLTQNISAMETWLNVYNKLKAAGHRYGGTLFFLSPTYVPVDLEIIKSICQRDFNHFVDRGIFMDESDPLTANLFSLPEDKWKKLRAKCTPAFTSGKTKMTFDTVVDRARALNGLIDSQEGKELDVKEIFCRLTMDNIGRGAFGLEFNTLENPDCDLRKIARDFLEADIWTNLKRLLFLCAPDLMVLLNVKTISRFTHNFFVNLVKDTINYREKNNIETKDFMHLLIQLKNTGNKDGETQISSNGKITSGDLLTTEEIAAEVFLFYLAGFETSATSITYCLYELARNQELQEEVRQEIKRIMKKYDDQLTYEGILEMNLLERCILETIRIYPPEAMLFRKCTKEYKVPGTDVILDKGQMVLISIAGIQRDEEYFPNPLHFDPERFTEENKRTRPAYTFLGFGEGPRGCIGIRFGMMQVKISILAVLLNYIVTVNPRTKEPIEFDTTTFITTTKGGMWLDFNRISDKHIELKTPNAPMEMQKLS